jgi:hypothetical protein
MKHDTWRVLLKFIYTFQFSMKPNNNKGTLYMKRFTKLAGNTF